MRMNETELRAARQSLLRIALYRTPRTWVERLLWWALGFTESGRRVDVELEAVLKPSPETQNTNTETP